MKDKCKIVIHHKLSLSFFPQSNTSIHLFSLFILFHFNKTISFYTNLPLSFFFSLFHSLNLFHSIQIEA